MRKDHHQHAHRKEVEVGDFEHAPIRTRRSKLFFIPQVVIDDRRGREIHRVEIEHPVGCPKQANE
jgi:hypothetical protein